MKTQKAELSNTDTMPSAMSDKSPENTRAVVRKMGSVGHLVPGAQKDTPPDVSSPPTKEQPGKNPQAKTMKPHVNVSSQEPPKVMAEKKASRTALGERYPLDSYEQVKTASVYFDEWYKRMDPADRHEFAVNMTKRASELGIKFSETAQKYGSETYAPEPEIKIAMDSRRTVLLGKDNALAVLDKLAEAQPELPPELFCETLSQFDKAAGLDAYYDSDVLDPYFSTYGFEKQATFSETLGNITVNEPDLEHLANKRLGLVKGTFTEELAEEFRKDPIGIYKSLPVEQRKVLANMAREQRSGAPGSY